MKTVMYAFWRYDYYPYYIGGECGPVEKGGLTYVPSFAGRFRPSHLFNIEDGQAIKKKLDALEQEYNKKLLALRKGYTAKADAVMEMK